MRFTPTSMGALSRTSDSPPSDQPAVATLTETSPPEFEAAARAHRSASLVQLPVAGA